MQDIIWNKIIHTVAKQRFKSKININDILTWKLMWKWKINFIKYLNLSEFILIMWSYVIEETLNGNQNLIKILTVITYNQKQDYGIHNQSYYLF